MIFRGRHQSVSSTGAAAAAEVAAAPRSTASAATLTWATSSTTRRARMAALLHQLGSARPRGLVGTAHERRAGPAGLRSPLRGRSLYSIQ